MSDEPEGPSNDLPPEAPDVAIEIALEETFQALVHGANPWRITAETEKAYKDSLRTQFAAQIASWGRFGGKVKRMANHTGSMAALTAQARTQAEYPTTLTSADVFMGAAFVQATRACGDVPPGPPGKYAGRFCHNVAFADADAAAGLLFGADRISIKKSLGKG